MNFGTVKIAKLKTCHKLHNYVSLADHSSKLMKAPSSVILTGDLYRSQG